VQALALRFRENGLGYRKAYMEPAPGDIEAQETESASHVSAGPLFKVAPEFEHSFERGILPMRYWLTKQLA
jgi:hypothetical protein